jgi:hypothetical protein
MSIKDYTIQDLGTMLIAIGIEMVNTGVGAPVAGDNRASVDRLVKTMMQRGVDEDTARDMLGELDLKDVVEFIPGDLP